MNVVDTVKSVTYSDNKRIATIERTVSRADDAETLGNLYFRMSDLYRRQSVITDSNDLQNIANEITEVCTSIEEYTTYLANYETTSE